MHTLTTDNQKRVRLPDAKPGQVFAYELEADGHISLREVKPVEIKQPKCRLVKNKHGLLMMDNGRTFTTEDVKKALAEEFP